MASYSSSSSSSANRMRREQSLARVAILSNYGEDNSSGSNSDDARADSPFTMLNRALDEMEKKGRPSIVESVAAVVTQRPDAVELTRLRERRRSMAAIQHTPSSSSHDDGMVLRPKAKSEAACDAERSRNRKQPQPQPQPQQQGQHPGYPPSSRDDTSSWTRDAPLRQPENALPVPPIPRASEGPLARRPVSMAASLPSVKTTAAGTQRPQARERRTSTARSDTGIQDRRSTHSDGGGAATQPQDQRRFPRGVPNNFQAYRASRASRASWAAPSVLERRPRRPTSVGREQQPSQPFEPSFSPRSSTGRASGVPEVETRIVVSTRSPALDPRELAVEIRDRCNVFLESLGPPEPRETTDRVDPSGPAVPGAGASFTQRVASGQTGPTAGSGASRRRISAYNPLFTVEIPPVFNDRPARSERQTAELHCDPPAALEIRGHCSEARLRAQASALRVAGLDFGFAAAEPAPAPAPVPVPIPVLNSVDSYDSLHLPKSKASSPSSNHRGFFAPWMPTPSAAETVADPSPLGSTLSFEPGEDHLDVRRPIPVARTAAPAPASVGRPGDDRYRLPSQTARRAPAPTNVVRRKPLPPVPGDGGAPQQQQHRIARVPVSAPMTDPAARRTLRRAGDVNVSHVRNGSA